MRTKSFLGIAMAAAAVLTLAAGTRANAEETIRTMTSLPKTISLAQSFIDNFIGPLNEAGKGVVKFHYLGGPEITPPRKAAGALKRGVVDGLHSPTAYYIGMVPEGYALTLSEKTATEIRANGGFALLQKIYAKKAGARLIAWGESGTHYHTYLATAPKFESNGNLSLKGIKMRVTGTYRPLFKALGATTIGIKHTEIYTGIERGVVQGFGWPDVGYTGLGVHKLIKYRIDPPFYTSNNAVTINLAKWNALSGKAKAIIEKVALEYETTSLAYMEKERKREEKMAFDAGMKLVKLNASAAAHYLRAANIAVWNRLKKQSDQAQALRRLFFPSLGS